MMEYVLLNNNVKMPKLGYGVFQVSNEECERCVYWMQSQWGIARLIPLSPTETRKR